MESKRNITEIFANLISLNSALKLTPLRKDVLSIFIQEKKPISAYDVLNKLRKHRDGAEPPTVYRVIEYFLQSKIIHRIGSENKYVFCTHLDHAHANSHGIIFFCKKCRNSLEIVDESYQKFLKSLSKEHHFIIDSELIEIKGTCAKCAADH